LRRSFVLAAATAALTLGLTACQAKTTESPADKAFGEKVRAYLLTHPEILIEVSQKLQDKQNAAANDKTASALQQHRQALERDPRDFVANPNGKITVTEFFDYRCGYCKLAAPEVVKLIKDNPDVRFVFKEFVIFGEASDAAARAALAAKDQGKYLEMYGRMMAEKSLDVAAVERIMGQAGLDVAKAKAAAGSAAMDQHVKDTHDLAVTLGVDGTPAFFVGDTVVRGADIDALKAAIAKAKKAA
jgi:protein-disulfide isomerase